MWHVTCDTWHVKHDTWHVTRDTWHVWGGQHSLKISAPQLSPFVFYDIMKIWRKRMSDLTNEWMNDEAVYRTAPATPGLLISLPWYIFLILRSKSTRKTHYNLYLMKTKKKKCTFMLQYNIEEISPGVSTMEYLLDILCLWVVGPLKCWT